jgi:hypothetical protein
MAPGSAASVTVLAIRSAYRVRTRLAASVLIAMYTNPKRCRASSMSDALKTPWYCSRKIENAGDRSQANTMYARTRALKTAISDAGVEAFSAIFSGVPPLAGPCGDVVDGLVSRGSTRSGNSCGSFRTVSSFL